MFSSVLGSEMPTTKEALHSRTLGRLWGPIQLSSRKVLSMSTLACWRQLNHMTRRLFGSMLRWMEALPLPVE
jgi:hypothetical protein